MSTVECCSRQRGSINDSSPSFVVATDVLDLSQKLHRKRRFYPSFSLYGTQVIVIAASFSRLLL
jgi:hypothetical protein